MVNRKAVRAAIYTKLTGASAITNLVNYRVYHAVAPSNATYPLIVFHKQAGSMTDTFDDPAFDTHIWLVKAIDKGSTSNTAEDIAAAVDAELQDGSLTITGGTLLDLRRQSDLDYLETVGDQIYRHHGSLYRVTVA